MIKSSLNILKYIGPGLLVTVGFIDPGNWATNVAAGAAYGNSLLWVILLATIMLVAFQHNAAHLGIVTGRCLSESITKYFPKYIALPIQFSAMMAIVATSLAEILGASIALNMLFGLPIFIGATLNVILISFMVLTNSYLKIEKWIMGFVSIIGISFLIEIFLVNVEWSNVVVGTVTPQIPDGAMLVVMGLIGAVVMPHNLFLHSEIIQSRQYNLEDETIIKKQLSYEFYDTLFSMSVGFLINSAMIIVAASTFYTNHIEVTSLTQASDMLTPLISSAASVIFAIALLMAGFAAIITTCLAGATIMAGIKGKPYNLKDNRSRLGIFITIFGGYIVTLLVKDQYQALIISQVLLSIQLPITVLSLLTLTSSKKVMGKYANKGFERIFLWLVAGIVIVLNIMLVVQTFGG